MRKNAKIFWSVVVLIVIIGLAWWGFSKNGGGPGNVIKIGFIGPLTGDAAVYGEEVQNTEELAIAQINAAGGVNGKQIQAIYEDGKCDGQDGANAAQKLVNVDGVQAIIGGFCSGETIPAVPIAASAKVVVFSPGASSPKLTGISPYFFRDFPSDATQGKVLADVAYNKMHWKTIGFVQEQTDYSQGINDAFTQNFQADGGKTITQSFPTGASDFRSMLITLKSQKPDALFIDTQTPAATDRVLDQLAQLNWKPTLLIDDATAGDPPTLTKYRSQLQGALTAEFLPNASDTQFQAFIQAYQAKYGKAPSYQAYMSCVYDAVNLLAQGIKQVGDNGSALAQWSRTITNWAGASGNITIGSDGDRMGGHVAEVIMNGSKTVIQ